MPSSTWTTSSPSIVPIKTGSGTQPLSVLNFGSTRNQGSMLPDAPAKAGAITSPSRYFSRNCSARP